MGDVIHRTTSRQPAEIVLGAAEVVRRIAEQLDTSATTTRRIKLHPPTALRRQLSETGAA